MFAICSRQFAASSVCPQRPARPRVRPTHVRAQRKVTLRDFFDDAASAGLGKIRFIVLGDGAILESVNNLGSVRYNEVPNRGLLATISSDDKSFECHVTLAKVKEVKFAKAKAKSGDYDMYATRFLGADSKVLMSWLLHGSQGVYDPASVAAWTSLCAKYGDSIAL